MPMFFKKNMKQQTEQLGQPKVPPPEMIEEANKLIKEVNKSLEMWKWVEGYKGTDENLMCKNNFQYEIGKTYRHDEDVVTGKSGFHLCLNLPDVCEGTPYKINFKNRYFKVGALVKGEDLDKYGSSYFSFGLLRYNRTIAAKEIEIISEISQEEYFNLIKKIFPFIETLEEYKEISKNKEFNYNNFCNNKFIKTLTEKGYSESFSMLLADKEKSYHLYKKAIAFADEGISVDMRSYLLLNTN